MPDKIVLVTGATGFIGQQTLQPLLDLGYKVHGISRKKTPAMPEIQWHACDLFDATETKALLDNVRPSHLLHLAWYAEHGKFWLAPENTTWLDASTCLFEQFVSSGGQRIVGAGTCAEYDWTRQDKNPWRETDACHPHTLYGQAKLALAQRLAALPISQSWARMFMLFGPHEKPQRLVPYVIRAALTGEDVLCSEGSQVRDFLDTRLCGRALACLLNSDVAGPINIGSGEAISIADLVKQICKLCDYARNIKFGAIPSNKNEPLFMVPDLSRLRNEVGFSERQNAHQALSEMIQWQRENISGTGLD